MDMSAPAPHQPDHAAPPVQAPKPKGSGLGIAALVLGIVGLVFAWIPFIGIFGVICGAIALVLGGVGFFVSHRWMSLAGFVCGVTSIVVGIAATGGAANEIDKAADSPATEQPTAGGTDKKAADKTDSQTAKLGQTVHSGDFDFTVTGTSHTKSVGGEFGETAQGEYTVLNVTIKNTGSDQVTFSDDAQKLIDTTGKRYSADTMADVAANANDSVFLSEINPGNSAKGKLLFDMPASATADKVLLSGGVFGDANPATISLR